MPVICLLLSGLLLASIPIAVFAQEPGGDHMRHVEMPLTPDNEARVTTDGLQGVCPKLKDSEFLPERQKIKSLWLETNRLIKSGSFETADSLLQQALKITRQIQSRRAEAKILHLIGWHYESQHQYTKAIAAYKKSVEINRQCQRQGALATTLSNLCGVYFNTAQYARSLETCQEAITLLSAHNKKTDKSLASALTNQGLNYIEFGQYAKAIELFEQALPLLQKSDNRTNLAKLYHNIGYAYSENKNHKQALKYYDLALAQRRQLDDQAGIASTLNNKGFLHAQQGQTQVALKLLKQALAIAQEVGDKPIEGRTLDSLGDTYALEKNYEQAQRAYNDALVIRKLVSDRRGERVTYGNIGRILEAQGRDALAITFYKQAVNVSEAIRGELHNLPSEVTASYTAKVSLIYRRLADLLLRHERVIEAQRVLDLLKMQELEDYLQTVRTNEANVQGLPESVKEQQVTEPMLKKLLDIVQLAKAMESLQMLERERTPDEEAQLELLDKKETALSVQFEQFFQSEEVRAWERNKADVDEEALLKVAELSALQDNLRQIGRSALVYPLILENRLELVLTLPEGSPVHKAVDISRTDLEKLIKNYLNALRNPRLDVRPVAEKLYVLLVAPFSEVFTALDIQTIIYVPDSMLRYVPLSALHDGKQWLIERFRVHRITSTTQSDFNKQPAKNLKLLAGAFSTGKVAFSVGEKEFNFQGLRFAGVEVETLNQTIPGTKILLDKKFTPSQIRKEARFYTAIHLATHAAFVAGHPDESFILFGDGARLTLKQVQKEWKNKLRDIDLIVLSACETGVGGHLGSGEEILGFGYLMELAGADASIATLWPVDDGGTQILMNEFYQQFLKPDIGKAEALRQAQLALIRSDEEGNLINRGVLLTGEKPSLKGRLSHPYYWAPFVLVGNGL